MADEETFAPGNESLPPGDAARFWREPRLDGLECLAARFAKHVYAPHSHDTYVLGVVTAQAEAFRTRGVRHLARAGEIIVINPGALHDGEAAADWFAYRMFYPAEDLVARALADSLGRPTAAPAFPTPVIRDGALGARLARLHRGLEAGLGRLEAESELLACLAALAHRHGRAAAPPPAGRESRAVRRARDFLDAEPGAPVGLGELAAVAGLSRSHLIRCFRAALGLTPHAYQTGRRIARAKALLAEGSGLAEAALACGFYDQSHFTRRFKAQTGVTPGQYRAGSTFVQDEGPRLV